jgi:predicted nucleic-acid-binding protein
MRAVDTNLLIRFWIRDDLDQVKVAERFIAAGAWVPLVALAEAIWVLQAVYKRPVRDLSEAVEMLLQHENLVVQDADVVEAALRQFRAKPTLGFSDCLILEGARKAGHLPLGTFDRKLGKLDGAEILR